MKTKVPLAAFAGYGIEAEYMIVDRHTLDVRPVADELLWAAAGRHVAEVERDGMGWSREMAMHVMEVKNVQPWASLAALVAAFQGEVHAINALLESEHAQLMPGAMHPWMDPRRHTRLWSHDAAIYRSYDRIFDCRRHGWVNIQSVHLNLPFANDEEFARLHAAIRLALPILPALAASSPFVEGRWSGFMDYRMEVYRGHQMRIPSTMGEVIPEPSGSRADYHEQVLLPMYREIVKYDIEAVLRHEWLNARAAIPRFERNAIEVRILDIQECPQADLAIAAAAGALIRRFYDEVRESCPDIETGALVRILNACIRDADQAMVDDERYLALFGLAHPCPARELWSSVVNEMSAGEETAPAFWATPLRFILERGPLARRLVEAVGRDAPPKRLHAAYRELCHCLQEGRMYCEAG